MGGKCKLEHFIEMQEFHLQDYVLLDEINHHILSLINSRAIFTTPLD